MNWLREPDPEPFPGYRLVEPIGTGGFGEVWKCVAPGGIHKAIKFVYGNLDSLDGDDARARQEKKALDRVKEVRHPFVLSIEQIQEVAGEGRLVAVVPSRPDAKAPRTARTVPPPRASGVLAVADGTVAGGQFGWTGREL